MATTPIKYRISSVAPKPSVDSVKGVSLTSLEIDGNFRSVKDSIEAESARIDDIILNGIGTIMARHTATATASQTVFNLPFTYSPGANNLVVFVNGLLMERGVDYTETSGSIVTFNSGLLVGQEVSFLTNVSPAPEAPLYSVAGITSYTMASNGVQTAFTLPVAVLNKDNTQIYNNGIYQEKSGYSIAGAVLSFSTAPASGNIEVVVQSTLAIGENLATQVSYTPAGAGAVATTVQSKLRETVSVKDFGVTGSGDETTKFQNALTSLAGSEGTGYSANPAVLDLSGLTITFTGTVYVPTNVSLVNGALTSVAGKIVWRNPYLANTGLRSYTSYWPYMTSRNRDVVFNCIVIINVYIGAKFNSCDFNGLVLVNSDSLWTEYNSFNRCSFAQNTTVGAAIRCDGNSSGTSVFSTGTGAGTTDGSFGYNNFESNCKIDSTAPQVGISVVDGGTLYNCHLGFQGYARGAGPSGAFLYIDDSSVNQCNFEVHLESFGAAANIFSIGALSNFWYNTGTIQSASPEMVMVQDASADLRANNISVVGVALQDSGGNAVFNGASYMTTLVNNVARRRWATPAFAAYTTSDQSLTSNVTALVPMDSEEYDTNGNFASSRFTPTVAGYYQINAQVRITATSSVANTTLHLYKNGSAYRTSATIQGLATNIVRTISTLVYMNGSTDYLEMYAYAFDNTAAPVIKGGAANSFFNGCLLLPS